MIEIGRRGKPRSDLFGVISRYWSPKILMRLPTRPISCPHTFVIVLTISSTSFFPAMGRAQDQETSEFLGVIQLDPITIEGQNDLMSSSTVHEREDIEQGRLQNFEDVLRATPGVGVNSSGGTNLSTVYIRGVGSMYPMSLDDSAATFTLDGSPLSARHISLGTLDAERIEILKGPQGTKSAAAALAGTVNVITAKPSRALEGYLRSEMGQEGQYLLEGAVGGPLSESLSGRVALRYSGSEHWVENRQTGQPVSDPKELAFRGSLLWEGQQGTSALLTYEHQKIEALPNLIMLKPYNRYGELDLTPNLYDQVEKSLDRTALQVTHDFGESRITSLTSYLTGKNTEVAAYDRILYGALYGAPGEFWNIDEAQEMVFNQDIRWASSDGAPFEWVLGASFEHFDGSYDTPRNTYGTSSATFRDFESERYSLYGNVTFPLSSDVKLSAGLRQTWTQSSYNGAYHGGGSVVYENRSRSEDFLTGQLGLSWDVAPETRLHAKIARGHVPGGYNIYATQPADSEPYRGATSDSIEVGFATAFADGAFELSGAVFANRVEDNHLLSYDSATYVVSALNADTRSRGIELQGTWYASPSFSIGAGLSYIDAEITSNVLGIGDGDVHSGNKVPDVAPWTAHLSANYRQAVPALLGFANPILDARLDYSFVGSRPADPQNHFDLNPYHKLDLRLGLTQGQTEFYVAAENLLDEQIELYGYYAPGSGTSYGGIARGRTVTVGVMHRF